MIRRAISQMRADGKSDDEIAHTLGKFSGAPVGYPVSKTDLVAIISQMEESLIWYTKQIQRYAMLTAQIRNNQPRNWGPQE